LLKIILKCTTLGTYLSFKIFLSAKNTKKSGALGIRLSLGWKFNF